MTYPIHDQLILSLIRDAEAYDQSATARDGATRHLPSGKAKMRIAVFGLSLVQDWS